MIQPHNKLYKIVNFEHLFSATNWRKRIDFIRLEKWIEYYLFHSFCYSEFQVQFFCYWRNWNQFSCNDEYNVYGKAIVLEWSWHGQMGMVC